MKLIYNLLSRFLRPKSREEAACYSYDDFLFLCAICEIRGGPGVNWEPYRRLSRDAPDDAIGKGLNQILDRSGRVLDLKNPSELRNARKEQLRAAGLSSERNLQRRAILCHVARLSDSVIFAPTNNGGTRGDGKGFRELNGAAINIPLLATDAELGTALKAALQRCTGVRDVPAV